MKTFLPDVNERRLLAERLAADPGLWPAGLGPGSLRTPDQLVVCRRVLREDGWNRRDEDLSLAHLLLVDRENLEAWLTWLYSMSQNVLLGKGLPGRFDALVLAVWEDETPSVPGNPFVLVGWGGRGHWTRRVWEGGIRHGLGLTDLIRIRRRTLGINEFWSSSPDNLRSPTLPQSLTVEDMRKQYAREEGSKEVIPLAFDLDAFSGASLLDEVTLGEPVDPRILDFFRSAMPPGVVNETLERWRVVRPKNLMACL